MGSQAVLEEALDRFLAPCGERSGSQHSRMGRREAWIPGQGPSARMW
jgi:hypothetical protein